LVPAALNHGLLAATGELRLATEVAAGSNAIVDLALARFPAFSLRRRARRHHARDQKERQEGHDQLNTSSHRAGKLA
jgi:hypothetical protein